MSARLVVLAALAAASCASASTPQQATSGSGAVTPQEWAATCKVDAGWDDPGPPFRIHGNSWYVGTCGIAAILITGPEGHVLIDSGTEKGAEIVAANVRRLGFRLEDVNLLLISHEHYDHSGGIAALQELSGADLAVSREAATVMASGRVSEDDPQFGLIRGFPAAKLGTILPDDGAVMLGDTELQAIPTPGHTLGATSWRWRSCDAGQCRSIVYADSLSAISNDSYRYSDHPALVAQFREGLARLAPVNCDILITPHPSASDLNARAAKGLPADTAGCANYAKAKLDQLEARLAKEAAR